MNDFLQQVYSLQIINLATRNTPPALLWEVFSDQYGEPDGSGISVVHNLSASTGVVISRQGSTLRIFAAGIGDKKQGNEIALGYLDQRTITETNGFNRATYQDAKEVWEIGILPRIRGGDDVELYGHSSGGMIVEAIADMVLKSGQGISLSIDTFGCPAPSLSGSCASSREVNRQRWMNQGDPVPLVPFGEVSPGRWFALLTAAYVRGTSPQNIIQPSRYQQPGAGTRISRLNFGPANVPSLSQNPAAEIGMWLNGGEKQLQAHSVGGYVGTFIALASRPIKDLLSDGSHQGPGKTGNQQIKIERPLAIPRNTAQGEAVPITIGPGRIATDVVGNIIGSAEVEQAQMAFTKINPKKCFRLVRVGRQWQVSIGETIVAVADAPRKPRALCNRLNGVLRAIGTNNTIWLPSLIGGLTEWLTAASTDDTYARPTVRVDF